MVINQSVVKIIASVKSWGRMSATTLGANKIFFGEPYGAKIA